MIIVKKADGKDVVDIAIDFNGRSDEFQRVRASFMFEQISSAFLRSILRPSEPQSCYVDGYPATIYISRNDESRKFKIFIKVDGVEDVDSTVGEISESEMIKFISNFSSCDSIFLFDLLIVSLETSNIVENI